jgi:uncharacterized protein YjbI with pentapeptide repeats
LSGANLVVASFFDAWLAKAELEFAVMANAMLQGACLREAYMSGTVLDGRGLAARTHIGSTRRATGRIIPRR